MNTRQLSITGIQGRQILDSRGNPTVEAEVILSDGALGRAAAPSGASAGVHEALELRDGDCELYNGLGVLRAVSGINNELTNALVGMNALNQEKIDQTMIEIDGSSNKDNLGANAILAVSLACARAAAQGLRIPLYQYLGGCCLKRLPIPLMNVLNGGVHADNPLNIQEFMLCPYGFETYSQALEAGVETYHALKKAVRSKGYSTNVGDEGGFAPEIKNAAQAFDLLSQAILNAGYVPGEQIGIAIDAASSEFYDKQTQRYNLDGESLTVHELIEKYVQWTQTYPLVSIEDGCAEDDWEGWRKLTERLRPYCQLVGDDLFVTNPKRLKKGIEQGIANSVLVKLNQIGTLSETFDTIRLAQKNRYTTIVSHRSGETDDTFIADLAVASHSSQIKTGAPCRSERTCKYNQLLRIEEELGDSTVYAGPSFPFSR